MKILATFDGSAFSEAILPQLQILCALPDVELILMRVDEMPHGQTRREPRRPVIGVTPANAGGPYMVVNAPAPEYAENKEQAVERELTELRRYLESLAKRLPAGVRFKVHAVLGESPADAIIKFAMAESPDMIVMATHGHTGLVHVLFGDVAENVVKSGVAPVLLVHPDEVRTSRTDSAG
jgi:nucleotide-binding universal stress UspA family protein